MDAKSRKAYEREHGVGAPGYRGTGEVHWFARFHPDDAPCCRCGVVTDRWVVGGAQVQYVAWGDPHVDQAIADAERRDKKRALCWDSVWPFCERCERRHSIAVLEQRQQNLAILAELRAREATQLAALREEERSEAVAA